MAVCIRAENLALDDPGKAINLNRYDPNEDSEIPNLLSLSNEVFVKIMHLSKARDRVKLHALCVTEISYKVSVKNHHYGVSLCGPIVTVMRKSISIMH